MPIPTKPLETTARRVIVNAEQRARSLFSQDTVGTESLLIALIEEDDEVSEVLCARGLALEAVISAAASILGLSLPEKKGARSGCKLPHSRALDNILLRAEAIASNRDDYRVCTVHLALALVRNDVGIVSKLFERFDIDRDALDEDLSQLGAFAGRLPTTRESQDVVFEAESITRAHAA